MKMLCLAALAALFLSSPALAQWQTPNHSVPVGRGAGVSGFGSAAPGATGIPLTSNGASSDPTFHPATNAGIAPGAANTLKGSTDGSTTADLAVPACTGTTQSLRWTAATGFSCGTVSVTTGFDTPINFGLSASAAASALTINVTQANGSTATGTNPIFVPFRSLTTATGTVTYDTISAALSLVVPSGATLGTSSSNVPFRLWIFLAHNGGTPEIGVATCSSATSVFPCASWEYTLKTTTTISAGAGTGGVLYTTTGVALDAVRIVGFCDFASGLATAGTWASSCTTLQVFGPGVKKPGDTVQSVVSRTGASATGTGTFTTNDTIPTTANGDQYLSQAITPAASMNVLKISSQWVGANTTGSVPFTMALFQDATANALAATWIPVDGAAQTSAVLDYSMIANTVAATTFKIRAGATGGTTTFNGAAGSRVYGGVMSSFIRIEEIMGFDVREPANDNVHPGVFSKVG